MTDENKLAPKLQIVVLKPMFSLEEVDLSEDPDYFYIELEKEIEKEVTTNIGPIKKIRVFEVWMSVFIFACV